MDRTISLRNSVAARAIPRGAPAAWLCGLMILAAACSGGCAGPLATILYLTTGNNTPAACKLLEEKKIAVVCRVPPNLEYRSGSAARDLASQVAKLLRINGKKMNVIEAKEIERFTDENNWEDPAEIGKAVDAEMVLVIELEEMSLFEHQTLYRGKANVVLKIHDMKEKEIVWEDAPPQLLYPPNVGIPTTDRQTPQFQREFLGVIATEIAQKFCAYDSSATFAGDAAAFKRANDQRESFQR